MRRALVALMLFLLWSATAHADKPIPPHTWEREVGSFRFVMLSPYDRTPQASEGRGYPASGLYRADGSPQPLWTVDWYANEGEVFLSPDGQYLVRMGPWPGIGDFDELAVAFYRHGALTTAYLVRDLVENPSLLPESVSHYAWRGEVTFDPGQLRLTVATISGVTYRFDVPTGEILQPDAPVAVPRADVAEAEADRAPAGRIRAIVWTVGGLLVAVGGILILAKGRRRP